MYIYIYIYVYIYIYIYIYIYMRKWSPLICAEKALHGAVDIWDYVKTYTFNNFVYF